MSGPPKISLSFGASKKAAPSAPSIRLGGGGPSKKPAVNGNNRPRTALHDSDSEDDTLGHHQEISHFDQAAGGAIHTSGTSKSKGPLVIQVQANSDRLQYKRRKQQTSELPADTNGEDIKLPEKKVTFGLTVMEKKTEEMSLEAQDNKLEAGEEVESEKPKQKTEDETAMDALLGNTTSSRTIPVNEDEALHRDLADAQDAPTLEEYMAIPVSDFGAACLRGMGWKDTETLDDRDDQPATNILKPKVHERRPALLGVGAKPSSAVGIELGEWGKTAKHKKGKDAAVGYNPVVLKNKATGEMVTEEELERKLKEQESVGNNEMVFGSEKKSSKDDWIKQPSRLESGYDEKKVDRDRYEERERKRRDDGYDDRKRRESRRDDEARDRKHRDRYSDDDRRDRKRRHSSKSRSPSRDRHKSRKYEDDYDRKSRSKYDKDERYSKSDRRDRDRDREYDRDRNYESSSRRR